jgi:hypothetical protein
MIKLDGIEWKAFLQRSSANEVRVVVWQLVMLTNTAIGRSVGDAAKEYAVHLARIIRELRENDRIWIVEDIIAA